MIQQHCRYLLQSLAGCLDLQDGSSLFLYLTQGVVQLMSQRLVRVRQGTRRIFRLESQISKDVTKHSNHGVMQYNS